MAERTTANQKTQIGLETTPGTPVDAKKLLQSLSIEPQPQATIQTFTPAGQKFATITALNQEWMQANLTGAATYTELVYPLSSVLRKATITTPDGATDAREWAFGISPDSADDVATFTIEQGDAVRAHRFAHAVVTAFGLNFTRQNIEVSGTMLGTAMEDGESLTAAPTAIDLVPILATQVDVFLDSAPEDFGTTQLDRAFIANLQLGDRQTPFWPLDSRLGSGFGGLVEGVPSATFNLTLEADADGMAPLANMRAGSTVYARVQATGPEIEAGHNYQLTIDMALQVGAVHQFSDQDGIYAVQWPFTLVRDAAWGEVIDVTLVTSLASL